MWASPDPITTLEDLWGIDDEGLAEAIIALFAEGPVSPPA